MNDNVWWVWSTCANLNTVKTDQLPYNPIFGLSIFSLRSHIIIKKQTNMSTIGIREVIWPDPHAHAHDIDNEQELRSYADTIKKLSTHPIPKSIEDELRLFVSFGHAMAACAFNIILVKGKARLAFYGSDFDVKCMESICRTVTPRLYKMLLSLTTTTVQYKSMFNVFLTRPENQQRAKEVAELALYPERLDIAIGEILEYKCPLPLHVLSKMKEKVIFRYHVIVDNIADIQLFSFACPSLDGKSYQQHIKKTCKKIKACFKYYGVRCIQVHCYLQNAGKSRVRSFVYITKKHKVFKPSID